MTGLGTQVGPSGCDSMLLHSLLAHFHHIFEQLRFRQSSMGSIFLSAGESYRAGLGVVPKSCSGAHLGTGASGTRGLASSGLWGAEDKHQGMGMALRACIAGA